MEGSGSILTQDGRSLALFGSGKIDFFFGKGEIAGAGAVGGSKPGQLDRAVAEDFAPKLFRNLSSSNGHRTMN